MARNYIAWITLLLTALNALSAFQPAPSGISLISFIGAKWPKLSIASHYQRKLLPKKLSLLSHNKTLALIMMQPHPIVCVVQLWYVYNNITQNSKPKNICWLKWRSKKHFDSEWKAVFQTSFIVISPSLFYFVVLKSKGLTPSLAPRPLWPHLRHISAQGIRRSW